MGLHKPIDLICIDCKAPFVARSEKALRCSKCRRARQSETVKIWQRVHRKKERQAKHKPVALKMSLKEVLQLQEEYNRNFSPKLSYGNFVSLLERGCLDDKLRQISKQKNKP